MTRTNIVQQIINFQQKSFIQILRRTMIALFPLVLVGSLAWVIYDNLLSTNGFLGSTLNINQWLPFRSFLYELFRDVTKASIGWLTPYAALLSAFITTRYFHRENIIAGIAAMACYSLIFVHGIRGNNQVIDMRYYSASWFLIGVIVGYIVGRIFAKYGQPTSLTYFKRAGVQSINSQILKNIYPFILTIILAFLFHLGYALIRQFNLDTVVTQWVSSLLNRNSNYFLDIILELINTIFAWLGFVEPLTATSQVYTNEMIANLGYALSHKTPWGIPYPFTPSSLYSSFSGLLVLALVIAILWVDHNKVRRTTAKWSLLPSLFNVNWATLYGFGVLWNLAYLLPFILLPILNILIGSCLIFLHIIPPLVYPIPNGTPGILIPFIATGGNWLAMLFTVGLLILDIAIFIPFVKLSAQVEKRTKQLQEGNDHETK